MSIPVKVPSPLMNNALDKLGEIDKYLPQEAQEALKPIEQKIPKSIEHFFNKEVVTYTKERADVDLMLLNILDENPTISKEELLQQLNASNPNFSNNELSSEFLNGHITRFLERRDQVRIAIESCESPEELFKKLFGREPVGEIQLAGGTLSVNFVCFNKEDFNYVAKGDYATNPRPIVLDGFLGCIVRTCLDEKLKGAVIATKSHDLIPSSEGNNFIGISELNSTDSIIKHEEVHSRLRLLADKKDLDFMDNLEDIDLFAKRVAELPEDRFKIEVAEFIIQARELVYEYSLKDELAAFLFQGMDTKDIALRLKYEYRDQERFSAILKHNLEKGLSEGTPDSNKSAFAEIAVEEIFENYYTVLNDAIETTSDLLSKGYTKKEISLILQNIHLRQFIHKE